jgi:glycosyltransferase involved in cell wall biosynthesis
MNFCFISDELPPETSWGGIATSARSMAEAFSRRGISVDVICLSNDKNERHEKINDNLQIHRITLNFNHRLLDALYFSFLSRKLKSFLKRFFPSVVYTFEWNLFALVKFKQLQRRKNFDFIYTAEYNSPALLISYFYKVPIVIIVWGWNSLLSSHNNLPADLNLRIRDFLERMYVKRAKVVMTVSWLMADLIHQWVGITKRVGVIPFFVDAKLFRPTSKKENKIILFVGRIEFRKGVDLLLQSFVSISKEFPKHRLIMVGSEVASFPGKKGKLISFRKYLQSPKIPASIRKKIKIVDWLGHKELVDYYQKSAVCVFPSRFEPFGLVVLEAMACGKPVIGSLGTGMEEMIVHKKNGLLVEPTLEGIKMGLRYVLKNDRKRKQFGRLARETVMSSFNESKTIDKILSELSYIDG